MMEMGKTIQFVQPSEIDGLELLPELKLPWLDTDDDDEGDLNSLFVDRQGYQLIYESYLSVIMGGDKAGKSALGLSLIVARLRGEFLGIRPARDNMRILLLDTEQGAKVLRMKLRAVLRMSGMDEMGKLPNCIRAMDMLPYTIDERIEMTEKAVSAFRPHLLVLDGAVDVCHEFNSEVESRATIEFLMRLTGKYNCAILTAIHVNKGKGNRDARGHLGAMLAQKGGEVFQVTKDEGSDISTISMSRSRFGNIPDIRLKYGKKFMIYPLTAGDVESEHKAVAKRIADAFAQAGQEEVNKGTLSKLLGFAEHGSRGATNFIDDAEKRGLLTSRKVGASIMYRHTPNDAETDFADINPKDDEEDDI